MSSYGYGKDKVCGWVLANFPGDAEILDVGACDGVWRRLLPQFPAMDAVEAFWPNAARLEGYRNVFLTDIRKFEYEHYDLIIFGDVIEHLRVEDAQTVLAYAWHRCKDMIVAVPWLYEQGEIYGNPYERHIQDDLTPELFAERYPGFEVLCDPGHNYCYFHKGAPT